MELDRLREEEAWNAMGMAMRRSPSPAQPVRSNTYATTQKVPPRPSPPARSRPRQPTKKHGTSILGHMSAATRKARNQRGEGLNAEYKQWRTEESDLTEPSVQREAHITHDSTRARQPQPNHAGRPRYPQPAHTTRPRNNENDAKPHVARPTHFPVIRPVVPQNVEDDAKPHPLALQERFDAPEQPVLTENEPMELEPAEASRPPGPFSLNSAAGVQAIRKALPRPTVPPLDEPIEAERPTGPIPLNSAAGVQAVRKALPRPVLPFDEPAPRSVTERFLDNAPRSKSAAPRNNGPKISFKKKQGNELLPITASDLQLYKWRLVEHLPWEATIQQYSELTNTTPKREDALRKRLRQIQSAIDTEDISNELCQNALGGDEQALAEVNSLVAAGEAESARIANEPLPFRKVARQEPTRAPTVFNTPAPPAFHPFQGGKHISYDTMHAYLAAIVEQYDPPSESEDESDAREGSLLTEGDYVHYVYNMERRDLDPDEIAYYDDGELDDEAGWKECTASFKNLGHANAEAAKFVFYSPQGGNPHYKLDGDLSTSQTYRDGMLFITVRSDSGMAQVRVTRRMRTFQEHVLPETKEGWLPKTLYRVHMKTCKKAPPPAEEVDDLFGEVEAPPAVDTEVVSRTLDGAVYSTLDLANSRAMDQWIRQTVKPRSTRLEQIQVERSTVKAELERAFEDQKGVGNEREALLFKEALDDAERSLEVYVEALRLEGPRN